MNNPITIIRDAIKRYLHEQNVKRELNNRMRREAEIMEAFVIERSENGNYYLKCGDIYLFKFSLCDSLEDIEEIRRCYVKDSLECQRTR